MPTFQVLAGIRLSIDYKENKSSPCSYFTLKIQYSARQRRNFGNPYEFPNKSELGYPSIGIFLTLRISSNS